MVHRNIWSCVFLLLVTSGVYAQDTHSPTDVFSMPLQTAGYVLSSTSFPSLATAVGEHEVFENIRYNRVDGVFVGIGSARRLSLQVDSTVLVHMGAGYAFGSHYWQAEGGLGKRFGERDWATVVGVEGHHHTDTRDAWKMVGWENSLRAFVAGDDTRQYFQRTGWSVYAEQYVTRELLCRVQVGQEQYHSLPTSVTWSLFGGEDRFQTNAAVREGLANTAQLVLWFSSVPKLRRARAGIEVRAQAEMGRGDYSYERYSADVVWRQSFSAWGALNTRIRLGVVRGVSEALADFALGGSGSLPGYTWNESTGNRMGLWNTEVLLRGSAFSSGRIASSISLVVFTDVGFTTVAQSTALPFEQFFPTHLNQWMADVGVALGSRNGAVRIGAAWRTDTSAPPALVLRFSPTL